MEKKQEFYVVAYEGGQVEGSRTPEGVAKIVEGNKNYSHLKNGRIFKVEAVEEFEVAPASLVGKNSSQNA